MNNRKTVMIEPEISVRLSVTEKDETSSFREIFIN